MDTRGVVKLGKPGDSRPLLRDLYDQVVPSVADKWKELGVQLLDPSLIDQRVLEVIAADHPHSVDDRCKSVFEKWLNTQENASWQQLLEATKSVRLDYLSSEIENKLKTGCYRLNLKDLTNVMRHDARGVAIRWYTLGVELLDGDTAVLDVIKTNYQHDDDRCTEMFKKWLEMKPDASWSQLVTALNDIGLNTAADNVRHSMICNKDDYSSTDDSSDEPVATRRRRKRSKSKKRGSTLWKDQINLKDLNDVMRQEARGIAIKWYTLGVELLDGHTAVLDVIETTYQSDDNRCSRMFEKWLEMKPDASWSQLVIALNNIGLNFAADNVYHSKISKEDQINLKDLNNVMRQEARGIAIKWYTLGVELLGGHTTELDVIETNYLSDDDRCSRMFKKWLEMKPDASWSQLVIALKSIGLNFAADNVYHSKISKEATFTTDAVTKYGSSYSEQVRELTPELAKQEEINERLKAEIKNVKSVHDEEMSAVQAQLQIITAEIDLLKKKLSKYGGEIISSESDQLTSFVEYELSTVMQYVIQVDGPHQITCNGQTGGCFAWDDYGLKIQFHPNCSQHFIELSMSAYLPLKSEVFPGFHIVSTVIQFHCSVKKFDKPIILHLQHCVKLESLEDCQNMCFVMHKKNKRKILQGLFQIGGSYGAVTIPDFCYLYVATRKRKHAQPPVSKNSKIIKQSSDLFRYEEMCVLPKNCSTYSDKDWNGFYSIYHQHNGWRRISKRAILAENKVEFPVEIYTSQVEFDSKGVATLIFENETDETWAVGFEPEQISKENVNQRHKTYQQESDDPTFIEYHYPKLISKSLIYVRKREHTAHIPLNGYLTIDGITQTKEEAEEYKEVQLLANCKKFRFLVLRNTLTSPSSDTGCIPTQVIVQANCDQSVSSNLHTIGMLDTEPEMGDLITIVIPNIKAHWEEVAYVLRFKIIDVNAIKEKHKDDPKKCCQQLFIDWLSTNKGVTPKTWPTLLAKLGKVENLVAVIEEIKSTTVTA